MQRCFWKSRTIVWLTVIHLWAPLCGQVAVVHCSAQTLASHVIRKLGAVCSVSQTQTGRMYRPKEASRVVLYLKDINLPKPDKCATGQSKPTPNP